MTRREPSREEDAVTRANQQISRIDDDMPAAPESDDAVTRANQRISRGPETESGELEADAATLNPPD